MQGASVRVRASSQDSDSGGRGVGGPMDRPVLCSFGSSLGRKPFCDSTSFECEVTCHASLHPYIPKTYTHQSEQTPPTDSLSYDQPYLEPILDQHFGSLIQTRKRSKHPELIQYAQACRRF
ncbi:hypothetical protein NPIL_448051 [Nephila pilipes]|uniref:Uncharacterized protein n=1 Tax=Nephila pilipes TaxID=299642 RepID=A0A8X6TGG7_NEPPI|nr:hypothetical protein NPIL_448051 [Nephila pilipes]